jgi:NAD(P)-dependent dehydrogenase (short-subunit alcohol dehydrogenase family)
MYGYSRAGRAARVPDGLDLVEIACALPLISPVTPADIAPSVAFLTPDDAAYITGHSLIIDGGLTAQ